MRVFAISDLHLDYAVNREWLQQLPRHAYNDDVLILAGDVSDRLTLLEDAFKVLTERFAAVLFVPGNHDLWVNRESLQHSFEKLDAVLAATREHGVRTDIYRMGELAIVPLLGWYDYSFGAADDYLKSAWADYRNCRWPGHDETSLTRFFTEQNPAPSSSMLQDARQIVTFSHFLPRIDLMPARIPDKHRKIYPVLGAISGASIVWIGAMLLYKRTRVAFGGSGVHHDHRDDHGHDHSHPHTHEHGGLVHDHGDGHVHSHIPEGDISMGSLVALGASGGLVPCPSALVLLLSSVALGRVGLGLTLLLAFSTGLAVVLSGIGLVVLYAKNLLPDGQNTARNAVFRYVPVASAAVIVCAGILMTGVALGVIRPFPGV